MQNTIATYKTEAAVGTLSAVSLGTNKATNVQEVPILQMHIADTLFGLPYYLTLGDSIAIISGMGVIIVLASAGYKAIKSKIK